jgi:hypothetical protein
MLNSVFLLFWGFFSSCKLHADDDDDARVRSSDRFLAARLFCPMMLLFALD